MSLLCSFLCGLKILLLTLSTISVKYGGSTFYSNAVNGVIFIYCNINTLRYGFLAARDGNGNGFKNVFPKIVSSLDEI